MRNKRRAPARSIDDGQVTNTACPQSLRYTAAGFTSTDDHGALGTEVTEVCLG
jgi:hypothetical protein